MSRSRRYTMSEGELEQIIKGATRPAGSDFSEAEFANVLRGAVRPN